MTDLPNPLPPRLTPTDPPASPLGWRLLNVFSLPGRVFEEVRDSLPARMNWLVPTLLSGLAFGWLGLVTSQTPEFQKRLTETQTRMWAAASTTNAAAPSAGAAATVTPAEEELLQTLSRPEVIRVFVAGGGFGFGVLRVAGWSVLLWLAARLWLRQRLPLGKAFETAGLASLIGALGAVVLGVVAGDAQSLLTAPGPDASLSGRGWFILLLLNFMNCWQVAVLALGLARVTQVRWNRAAVPVVLSWLMAEMVVLLLGGLAM